MFRLPLVLLGFPPGDDRSSSGGINLVYQFWIHTEAIGRMPRWFEAVMNTPSHHRVHHAHQPALSRPQLCRHLDRLGRLFGTFDAERDEDRARYGIVKNLGTFNLLWAGVPRMDRHRAATCGRRRLACQIGLSGAPPGWSHDDSRDTSEKIARGGKRWLRE